MAIDVGAELVNYFPDPEIQRLMAELIAKINEKLTDHEERIGDLE